MIALNLKRKFELESKLDFKARYESYIPAAFTCNGANMCAVAVSSGNDIAYKLSHKSLPMMLEQLQQLPPSEFPVVSRRGLIDRALVDEVTAITNDYNRLTEPAFYDRRQDIYGRTEYLPHNPRQYEAITNRMDNRVQSLAETMLYMTENSKRHLLILSKQHRGEPLTAKEQAVLNNAIPLDPSLGLDICAELCKIKKNDTTPHTDFDPKVTNRFEKSLACCFNDDNGLFEEKSGPYYESLCYANGGRFDERYVAYASFDSAFYEFETAFAPVLEKLKQLPPSSLDKMFNSISDNPPEKYFDSRNNTLQVDASKSRPEYGSQVTMGTKSEQASLYSFLAPASTGQTNLIAEPPRPPQETDLPQQNLFKTPVVKNIKHGYVYE